MVQANPGRSPQDRFATAGQAVSLETERFRLRSLRPSDASDRYLGWIADPAVMTPLNMPARRLTMDDLRAHISGFDNRTRYLVGMFDRETGVHFGVFLVDVLPQHRLAKLQYLIGERDYRGTGAFRETAAALITHLFRACSVEKIAAQITVGNEASIAAIEALGFRREGEMKGEIRSFEDGRRLDQIFFGILADEWSGAGNPDGD